MNPRQRSEQTGARRNSTRSTNVQNFFSRSTRYQFPALDSAARSYSQELRTIKPAWRIGETSVLTGLKSASGLSEVALRFAVNLQINVSSTASEQTSDFSRSAPFPRSGQTFVAEVARSSFALSPFVYFS